MGTPLLHVGATLMCPHAGQVTIAPGQPRVRVNGQPVATLADSFVIAGCPFTVPGPVPQPCVTVRWLVPSLRVRAGGQFVILQQSVGLTMSATQVPQGAPIVTVVQPRVTGL